MNATLATIALLCGWSDEGIRGVEKTLQLLLLKDSHLTPRDTVEAVALIREAAAIENLSFTPLEALTVRNLRGM